MYRLYLDAIFSCCGYYLTAIELQSSDCMVVFESFKYTTGSEVPYLEKVTSKYILDTKIWQNPPEWSYQDYH